MNRQLHFLPQEHAEGGYVQLQHGQGYLFEADARWRHTGRLTPVGGGKAQEFDFAYHVGEKRLTLELPDNLLPEQIYRLEIVKLPAGQGAQVDENVSKSTRSSKQGGQAMSITTNQATGELERLQEEVVYANYFRTSQHQTFAQKVASFAFVNDWQWAVEGLVGVQDIGKTVVGQERFDAFEIEGVQKAGGKAGQMRPLVRFHADENTDWCQDIKSLVYANAAPLNPSLTIGWANRPPHLGLPPMQAVVPDQADKNIRLTDAMISSGFSTGSRGKVSYVYQLPYYMYYAVLTSSDKLTNLVQKEYAKI